MPLAVLLPLIPSFIKAGGDLYKFIVDIRTAAKQTGEWDDSHETLFQDYVATLAASPQWQPDHE